MTYNSPFDREDLHKLASSLDNVVDFSYRAADRVLIYKIKRIPPKAVELATLIQRQSRELASAVSSLDSRKQAFEHCEAVKRLECDAVRVRNSAISELFELEQNAIELIKLKDLYAQLASATNRAKDAAKAVESLLFKRGPD